MRDQLTVMVRIALYVIAGRLVAGGWLPDDIAVHLTDPALIEIVTGAFVAGGTLAWYWASKARRALSETF